ncbi:MAG: peptidoglycan editing factor PgeF [Gammaproteobacteria bacterium]|nr:peptidoglycan editing factor PgeF [Gammaproteobacteria bacterium]
MLTAHVIEPDWPAPSNVRAYSTQRTGGSSHRPYDSLNLSDYVGDDPRRVRQNRDLLRHELRLPAEPVWLQQKHDRGVIAADRVPVGSEPLPADAATAHQPGHVCAVLTADCLPVVVCDSDGSRVSAIHAGWRGLATGVIPAALAQLGTHGRNLMAWLGPCIGPAAYEIDKPVRDRLLQATPAALSAFEETRAGHWRADLAAIARVQLSENGVTDIYGGGFCTYTESHRFYSHRREQICGRQATLIWLDD